MYDGINIGFIWGKDFLWFGEEKGARSEERVHAVGSVMENPGVVTIVT